MYLVQWCLLEFTCRLLNVLSLVFSRIKINLKKTKIRNFWREFSIPRWRKYLNGRFVDCNGCCESSVFRMQNAISYKLFTEKFVKYYRKFQTYCQQVPIYRCDVKYFVNITEFTFRGEYSTLKQNNHLDKEKNNFTWIYLDIDRGWENQFLFTFLFKHNTIHKLRWIIR